VSVHVTHSAAETEALGEQIAAGLGPGDLVVVRGEVGAGKTTLIRGACRGLGVQGPVTSPTFTIGQTYRAGELRVSHIDLYRLAGLESEEPALLDDYLGPDAIAFVEWPGAAGARLGPAAREVRLEHSGGDRRQIEVTAASTRK
jgi:tRNA threonylcarbamoyladenosine biosynthesis protein TsaE